MFISIDLTGSIGVVEDLPPHELAPNVWTRARNVRMHENFVQRSLGYQDAFSSDPTIAPLSLFPYKSVTATTWVYLGLTKAYVHDGVSENNITRAAGDYTGTVTDRWTGGEFGGVLVANNGVDLPQYWDGVVSNPMQNFGAAWPSTMRAAVMRPYKNFLVIGDVTKGATNYPYLVKWSDAAETGTLPGSWDEADPATLSGEKQLRNVGGKIVDFYPLDDINVVYKEGAMIAQTFVGGDFIFAWRDITNELGIFATSTIRNFSARDARNRSFVFGADDVIVHDGRGIESVISERDRRWLYNNIDSTNLNNCFVMDNQSRKEMWLCFPESGNQWPNLALVWYWENGSWSVEELPNLSCMGYGFFDPGSTPDAYADLTAESYEASLKQYIANRFNPSNKVLVAGSYADTKLYRYDEGGLFDAVPFTSFVERTGWGYVLDRFGKVVPNTEVYKLVTEIYPHCSGTGTLDIYVGSQKTPEEAVNWKGPYPFQIGVDKKVNPWVGGNLLSFKFQGGGTANWKLTGYDLSMDIRGSHW